MLFDKYELGGQFIRRCEHCEIDWPNKNSVYSDCPGCTQPTSCVWVDCDYEVPVDEEAASLASRLKFELHYESREQARKFADDLAIREFVEDLGHYAG